MLFSSLFILVIGQRLVELLIAGKNSRWMKSQGGYEVGADHYKYLIMLHLSFFIFLFAEVTFLDKEPASWYWLPLLILLLAQVLRFWIIYTLGKFWNTRIIILPGKTVIKKGPYRLLRHPNYLVVAIEFMVFPLIFQAYITALFFSTVNAVLLFAIRIPQEEQALKEATNYQELYLKKN